MADPTRDELAAQRTQLRQTLETLPAMTEQGLAVTEVQAQAREQLVALEGIASPATVDQRGQRVDNQVNIPHLYWVYEAAAAVQQFL